MTAGAPGAVTADGCTCLAADDPTSLARRTVGRTLITLGPDGTSSHDAAVHLRDRLVRLGAAPMDIRLRPTFEEVLQETLDTDGLALVPSAYRGATTFHWHSQLRLLSHFARCTPDYGLAVHPQRPRTPGPRAVVAAMGEVAALFHQICPPDLAPEEVDWVCARSTEHAAELVADGHAQVAVTNDSSRRRHELDWLAHRAGVDIVWLLFRVRSRTQH